MNFVALPRTETPHKSAKMTPIDDKPNDTTEIEALLPPKQESTVLFNDDIIPSQPSVQNSSFSNDKEMKPAFDTTPPVYAAPPHPLQYQQYHPYHRHQHGVVNGDATKSFNASTNGGEPPSSSQNRYLVPGNPYGGNDPRNCHPLYCYEPHMYQNRGHNYILYGILLVSVVGIMNFSQGNMVVTIPAEHYNKVMTKNTTLDNIEMIPTVPMLKGDANGIFSDGNEIADGGDTDTEGNYIATKDNLDGMILTRDENMLDEGKMMDGQGTDAEGIIVNSIGTNNGEMITKFSDESEVMDGHGIDIKDDSITTGHGMNENMVPEQRNFINENMISGNMMNDQINTDSNGKSNNMITGNSVMNNNDINNNGMNNNDMNNNGMHNNGMNNNGMNNNDMNTNGMNNNDMINNGMTSNDGMNKNIITRGNNGMNNNLVNNGINDNMNMRNNGMNNNMMTDNNVMQSNGLVSNNGMMTNNEMVSNNGMVSNNEMASNNGIVNNNGMTNSVQNINGNSNGMIQSKDSMNSNTEMYLNSGLHTGGNKKMNGNEMTSNGASDKMMTKTRNDRMNGNIRGSSNELNNGVMMKNDEMNNNQINSSNNDITDISDFIVTE